MRNMRSLKACKKSSVDGGAEKYCGVMSSSSKMGCAVMRSVAKAFSPMMLITRFNTCALSRKSCRYGVLKATVLISLDNFLNMAALLLSLQTAAINLGISFKSVALPTGPTGIRDRVCCSEITASHKAEASASLCNFSCKSGKRSSRVHSESKSAAKTSEAFSSSFC